MSIPSFRDVELLSTYLDGELSQGDAARLEARLARDPHLAAALDELRQSRSLLRRLPQRRAPRNFVLSPRMVGQKPPLPREYPLFRFSTVLATLLLLFTFAVNAIGTFSLGAMAPAPAAYGMGGGGGQEQQPSLVMEEAAATEAPAEPEAALPVPTQMAQPLAEDTGAVDTPAPQAKQVESEPTPLAPQAVTSIPDAREVGQASREQKPIPVGWQVVLAILALANACVLFIMRKRAVSQWRK